MKPVETSPVREWVVPAFHDMHQHLREGDELPYTTAWAGRWCGTVVAMPNTRDPLCSAGKIQEYRKKVGEHHCRIDNVIIPLYLTQDTTEDDIGAAREADIRCAKAYPRGKTSHSCFGIRDFSEKIPVFRAMARCEMILQVHPEHPEADAWTGERRFFKDIWPLLKKIVHQDGLRVSLEHLSTWQGVRAVMGDRTGRVVGTVTPHHALAHIGDLGNQWDSSYMCKPMLKDPADRDAIRGFLVTGGEKVLFGSDSAPWPVKDKHKFRPCSGCWTAPWLPPLIATVFEQLGSMDAMVPNLIRFTHDNAVKWWGIEPSRHQIRLTQGETVIPEVDLGYHQGYVPFWGGKTLNWKAERVFTS